MSDQDIETRAREMGWTPKDEFRGDPEKWRSAEDFVKRGEDFIPFLRANNKKLTAQLDGEKSARARLEAQVAEMQNSFSEFKKHAVEETKRQVQEERSRLKDALKAARKEGDHDSAVEIEDQIKEIDKTLDKAAAAPAPSPSPTPKPVEDPTYLAWVQDNPWMQDEVKAAAAAAIAHKLRRDGNTAQGRAFYDTISKEIDKMFPTKRPASKVDAGGGGGDFGSRSSSRGYDDLPSDAKAMCDKQAEKFVGENKVFKTKQAWRDHYVEQYFAGEEA